MNKNQLAYLSGFVKSNPDILHIPVAGLFTKNTVGNLIAIDGLSDYNHILGGVVYGGMALYFGWNGVLFGASRLLTYTGLGEFKSNKEIKNDKETFPLEHVDSVLIDDSSGLVDLLSRTWTFTSVEWGTVLRAESYDKTAVINEILNPDEAEKEKLIKKKNKNSLLRDTEKTIELGYNGFHHYHLGGCAADFVINPVDRCSPANWINLLTFNLGDKPEIIAYNRRHVYIPEDRKAPKNKLYKANWRQIYKYLK